MVPPRLGSRDVNDDLRGGRAQARSYAGANVRIVAPGGSGAVTDVVVVASTAPEFEAPAVAAVLRWRYAPTNVSCVGTVCQTDENVQPIERPGIRTVIRYELKGVNPQAEAE